MAASGIANLSSTPEHSTTAAPGLLDEEPLYGFVGNPVGSASGMPRVRDLDWVDSIGPNAVESYPQPLRDRLVQGGVNPVDGGRGS
jgi:hypothetical protein